MKIQNPKSKIQNPPDPVTAPTDSDKIMSTAITVRPGVQVEAKIIAGQLTDQYEKAVGGLIEQVKFGAMLLQIEPGMNLSRKIHSGPGSYDGSLKQWMHQNCPRVHYGTAMSFKTCAEKVRSELQIGKSTDMAMLLGAAADALNPKQKRVRASIEKFIAGKSKRQLLLGFDVGVHERKFPGGYPALNTWLKKNYPDLCGQNLSVDELPENVRDEFLAWNKEHGPKPPSGHAHQKRLAEEKWFNHMANLQKFMDKKILVFLDRIDLENYADALTEAGKTLKEILKK